MQIASPSADAEAVPPRRISPSPAIAGLAVSVALLAFACALSVLPPALVRIAPEMHLSRAQVSSLSAVLFLPLLIGVGLTGVFGKWVPKGSMTTAGCLGLCAGSLVLALAGGYGSLLGGAVLLGLGSGLIEGSAPALISEMFSGPRRTAAMNYSQMSFAAGAIGVPLVIAALLKTGGSWRLGFWGAGAVAALGILSMTATGTSLLGHPQPSTGDRRAMDGFTALLVVAMFCYVAAEVGIVYWLPTYFQKVLLAEDSLAAASNGLFWTGVIVGRLAGGSAGHWLGDVGLLRISALSGVAAMLAFSFISSPAVAMAMAGVAGFAFACIWPTILSYAGHVHGDRIGSAFPWIIAAGAVGASAGPVITGALTVTAGYKNAFLINPAFFAVIAVIVIAAPSLERLARSATEGHSA